MAEDDIASEIDDMLIEAGWQKVDGAFALSRELPPLTYRLSLEMSDANSDDPTHLRLDLKKHGGSPEPEHIWGAHVITTDAPSVVDFLLDSQDDLLDMKPHEFVKDILGLCDQVIVTASDGTRLRARLDDDGNLLHEPVG